MTAGADPAGTTRGTATPAKRKRRAVPRGVIVLGLLLYVGAFVAAAAGLAVPLDMLAGVPRWVPLLGALALGMLATGLLRRRRWAWLATLAFTAINAYYLVMGATLRGQNVVFGLSLLAVIAAYLLWPNVRAYYLSRDGAPQPLTPSE